MKSVEKLTKFHLYLMQFLQRNFKGLFIIFFLFFVSFHPASAQYFGRNKPYYKKFNYKVYETPHFDIYYYLKNDSVLNQLARLSEEWQRRHAQVFGRELDHNPLFIYNNHADFQQTTTISGSIGIGTGGVTEALKNRMVMPFAPIFAQTDHVLGHEMVHAFQYASIINGDSTNLNSLSNLPLWMVEGMAEYLSKGSVDGHTAMWIRDGVFHKKFPTFKDMETDPRYFPYRWGQAFWAFVGKTWGDDKILPLFVRTARLGFDQAVQELLGIDVAILEDMWRSASITYYQQFLPDSIETLTGEKVAFPQNAGDVNVSPALSPDGRYLVFLSEKDVISFDLFLADVKKKKVIRRLSAPVQAHEIDAMNNLESAGAWSPDSRYFAFTVYKKGRNELVIVDVHRNRLVDEIKIPGVPAFYQPAWSPDGNSIVVVGMVQGVTDLYQYFLKEKKVRKITDDPYAYLQPYWSHDGRYLVVATDRPVEPTNRLSLHTNIAIIDLETGGIEILPVFHGADNLNPLFSVDDRSVFFLSGRDGKRNLYRYDLDNGKVYQLTDYATGITGITKFSPAVSISRKHNELVYSYYSDNKYTIYKAAVDDFAAVEVPADSLNFEAAVLPPRIRLGVNYADKDWDKREPYTAVDPAQYRRKPYKSKFKLDYISNVQAGISTNSFSQGMAGSVYAIFSDMAGTQQMFTSLALNGQIYDFGGMLTYVNQKNRLTWGGSVSHIPYLSAYSFIKPDTLTSKDEEGNEILYPVNNLVYDMMRIFEDQVSVFAYYPVSTTRRFEFGASQAWYYYRIDRYNNYYDLYFSTFINQKHEKMPAPKGTTMQTISAAYVVDNSVNGLASPMRGVRIRLSAQRYFGTYDFLSIRGDYRKYLYFPPFTVALRGMYIGRHLIGRSNAYIYPLSLSYPYYMHGYDNSRIFENMPIEKVNFYLNQLNGNRMAVANLEVRFPLIGPKRLGLITTKFLYTEAAGFFDAGLTWDEGDFISMRYSDFRYDNRVPLFSAGVSLRINVMGFMVVEPYYAVPIMGGEVGKGYFGVNFLPGW